MSIVVVLAITAVAAERAATWLDRPFAGFLVNERMVIGNYGQYHWTGTEAGLRWPDRIVAADGRAVTSMTELRAVVEPLEVGTPVAYTIEREGRTFESGIATMRFTWGDLIVTFVIPVVSGLIYFGIGVVVFILKPDTSASWALLVACFFLSIFAITSFDIQSTHAGFIRLYLVANAFFPAAFLHLALIFPQRHLVVQRHPGVQAVPYALAAALAIPMAALYPRPGFLLLYQAVRVCVILAAGLMLASTLLAYFDRSSVLARQRARVILFGAALAFPVPAAAHYLSLFGGSLVGFTIQNNFTAIPIIVFPAAVAYAIARHNLFDVDVYIKRALGYVVMTGLVATAYLSTQVVVRRLVLQPVFGGAADEAYPLLFALLVVFLFNPVNRKVQRSVERLFFRESSDYKRTVSAVSGALTSMLSLRQIVQQVVRTLRSEMFIESAGVIVVGGDRACRAYVVADRPAERGEDVWEPRILFDDPLLELLRDTRSVVTEYDLAEDPRYSDSLACVRTLAETRSSIAIPLIYQETVAGALVLGHKKSGHFYSRDDLDLLKTMANQAAVAMQNALAHEDVIRYAEQLEASLRRIQVLESIKSNLAKFVPKTVQDLIEESPEAPSFEKREADVSVLFADISGYTKLSARMELDEVNRLVERYFGAFLDEIMRYGGDVNETAGDGLMVIFRDPDPRRHAEAAVRTALAIERRTGEINAASEGAAEPIAMHLGVNSGIASVGATKIEGVAGTRWTYTASGPTTNIAARLAALADGGVVIHEETRHRLGTDFEVIDLGPQSLKNVSRPVRAYRVTAATEQPAPVIGTADFSA